VVLQCLINCQSVYWLGQYIQCTLGWIGHSIQWVVREVVAYKSFQILVFDEVFTVFFCFQSGFAYHILPRLVLWENAQLTLPIGPGQVFTKSA
jgi:hypothetical protein